jgi:hypothetical protein
LRDLQWNSITTIVVMVLRYCAAGVAGVFMQIQRRQSASQRTGLPQAACHQMGLRHFRARQGKTMIRSMLLLMAASSIATPVSAVTLPAAQADVMYNAELYDGTVYKSHFSPTVGFGNFGNILYSNGVDDRNNPSDVECTVLADTEKTGPSVEATIQDYREGDGTFNFE